MSRIRSFGGRALAPAVLLVWASACAGTEKDTTPQVGAGTSEGPVYALTSQVITVNEQNSYVLLTRSLDGVEAPSLADGIEIGGRAIAAGPPESGALFVGSTTGPEVTRYGLNAEGELEKGPTVSFQSKGVSAIGEYQEQLQFVSPTKAYYFDSRTAQAIVWNPDTMTVTGSVALRDLVEPGAVLTFSPTPIRHEGVIVMPVAWRRDDGLGIVSKSAVVVLDVETDEVTIARDERCGYARDAAEGPDGRIYLATDAFGSAVFRAAPSTTKEPCLLRFDVGTSRFDPDYYVPLSTLTDGRTAGSLVAGNDGEAYVRAFDEEASRLAPSTSPRAVASAPAWGWVRIRLGDAPTGTPVDGAPLSNGSVVPLRAGSRRFVPVFAPTLDRTTLQEVPLDPAAPAMSAPGLVFSLVRLR